MPDRSHAVLAPLGFVSCYAMIPIGFAFLHSATKADAAWLMTSVFWGASLTAFFVGLFRHPRSQRPRREHWRILLILGFTGLVATTYFKLILGVGPASADWLEHALFPTLVLFASSVIVVFRRGAESKASLNPGHKQTINRNRVRYFGAIIAFTGFVIAIWHLGTTDVLHGGTTWWVIVGLALLGATGSAFSIVLMSEAARDGVGRFFTMSVRYGLAALVMIFVAAIYGDVTAMSWGSIVGGFLIGSVLVNATLFFALMIVDEKSGLGPWSLGMLQLLVPIVTTILTAVFGINDVFLDFNRTVFILVAVLVTAGCFLSEVYPNLNKQ